MNAFYPPHPQSRKKESLQTQHEFLNLLRLRHLHWMNSTDDPQIKQLHLEIAELIHKTTSRYHHLLDVLQEQEYERARSSQSSHLASDLVNLHR